MSTLDDYRRSQQRRGLADTTIDRGRHFLERFEQATDLLTATPADIEAFLDSLHVSNRTRGTYLSCMRAFFRWAYRADLIASDPAAKVDRPRTPRLLPRPLAMDDLRAAWSAAAPRMRCWLALTALQGLRCCEVANLRREDVRDDATPPLLLVTHGKGGHQRVLPLHPEVAGALRLLPMPRSGYLFPHHDQPGKPVRPHTVSHTIANYLRSVGVEGTAHRARHTFGTETYRSSLDLRLVQELLGHRSPSTTAGYAAFTPGKAVDVVGSLTLR